MDAKTADKVKLIDRILKGPYANTSQIFLTYYEFLACAKNEKDLKAFKETYEKWCANKYPTMLEVFPEFSLVDLFQGVQILPSSDYKERVIFGRNVPLAVLSVNDSLDIDVDSNSTSSSTEMTEIFLDCLADKNRQLSHELIRKVVSIIEITYGLKKLTNSSKSDAYVLNEKKELLESVLKPIKPFLDMATKVQLEDSNADEETEALEMKRNEAVINDIRMSVSDYYTGKLKLQDGGSVRFSMPFLEYCKYLYDYNQKDNSEFFDMLLIITKILQLYKAASNAENMIIELSSFLDSAVFESLDPDRLSLLMAYKYAVSFNEHERAITEGRAKLLNDSLSMEDDFPEALDYLQKFLNELNVKRRRGERCSYNLIVDNPIIGKKFIKTDDVVKMATRILSKYPNAIDTSDFSQYVGMTYDEIKQLRKEVLKEQKAKKSQPSQSQPNPPVVSSIKISAKASTLAAPVAVVKDQQPKLSAKEEAQARLAAKLAEAEKAIQIKAEEEARRMAELKAKEDAELAAIQKEIDKLYKEEEAERLSSQYAALRLKGETVAINWELLPKSEGDECSDFRVSLAKGLVSCLPEDRREQADRYIDEIAERSRFYESLGYKMKLVGLNNQKGYVAYLFENGVIALDVSLDYVTTGYRSNNAIYTMGYEDFAELSRYSKADLRYLIESDYSPLATRIIHYGNWQDKLKYMATEAVRKEDIDNEGIASFIEGLNGDGCVSTGKQVKAKINNKAN